jgi:non-canonical purine NTP pyrophosphatase (RdgB/HAM1 family)
MHDGQMLFDPRSTWNRQAWTVDAVAAPLIADGILRDFYAGQNGFGYDPIFYLPEYGCTSAELSGEEKNKISHRGKALRAIKDELK